MLGAARVWYAMSRDGLLPRWFARLQPTFRTPYRPTLIIGAVTAIVSGFVPIETLAVLVNIGVLSAFVVVCASVLILRRRSPEMERGFRTPLMPFTPIFCIAASLLLIASLGWETLLRFVIWLIIGLVIYFLYSRRHSLLARGETGIERDTNPPRDRRTARPRVESP
jgi:APA family basic amino acid/polyamine antiporter